MRLKGPVVQQVNNLRIRQSDVHGFAVWSPYGICLEDRFPTKEAAVKFCQETTDFIHKK